MRQTKESQSPDLVSSQTPAVSLTRQIHLLNLLKAKTQTNIYKRIIKQMIMKPRPSQIDKVIIITRAGILCARD